MMDYQSEQCSFVPWCGTIVCLEAGWDAAFEDVFECCCCEHWATIQSGCEEESHTPLGRHSRPCMVRYRGLEPHQLWNKTLGTCDDSIYCHAVSELLLLLLQHLQKPMGWIKELNQDEETGLKFLKTRTPIQPSHSQLWHTSALGACLMKGVQWGCSIGFQSEVRSWIVDYMQQRQQQTGTRWLDQKIRLNGPGNQIQRHNLIQ